MTDEKNDNMRFYDRFARPPQNAMKTIKGGRLSGMSDINPQWRVEALTEMFGPVGMGWWYEITRRDVHKFDSGEQTLFVEVTLHVFGGSRTTGTMPDGQAMTIRSSHPIVGTGGSMLVTKEKGGLRVNDEAEKMAVTDALSVCCKLLGIGSDVYRGRYDTKYSGGEPAGGRRPEPKPKEPDDATVKTMTASIMEKMMECETFTALQRIGERLKEEALPAAAKDKLRAAYQERAKELNPVAR